MNPLDEEEEHAVQWLVAIEKVVSVLVQNGTDIGAEWDAGMCQ